MNRAGMRKLRAAARQRGDWGWRARDIDPKLLAQYPAVRNVRAAWVNDFYIVQVYEVRTALGMVLHLAISPVDGKTEPGWKELQRIKDDLVGTEAEAIQVYPKTNDVVDQANMWHLFVLPLDWPLPFGLHRENGLEREAP